MARAFGHHLYDRPHGFTLVELAVVIGLVVLLGIVSTNVLTNARGWLAAYRLNNAASDLYLSMQKCRMNAIKDNQDWAIIFDTNANRYLICSDKGADGSWSNTADNQVSETVDLSDYKSGIRYGHGSATFAATSSGGNFPADDVSFNHNVAVFNSRGFASTNGYVYICNGSQASYAIGAITSGLLKIRKWSGTEWQ